MVLRRNISLNSSRFNGGNADARMDGKAKGVPPPFDIAPRNNTPLEARLSMLGVVSLE